MTTLSLRYRRLIDAMMSTDLSSLPWWRSWGVVFLRIIYAVLRDLSDGQTSMRAMSLVYTSLLSMVPLLAISFSVLKGFGVHNQIEPFLLEFLTPMGSKGVEIAQKIIEFVENIKAGVLGSLGLGLLVYTVIALMQKIERAFNQTWHVSQTRPLAQRFSGYLSVVVVGPLLIFSSIGITASVMSADVVSALAAIQPFGELLKLAGKLVPYVLIILAFMFIYVFMPNTKVKIRSAFVGALVAGVLWQFTGWLFASFVMTSTQYTAIYSAFASLIIFMIWLYLGWLILLTGSGVAFYHQHPEYIGSPRGALALSSRVKIKLALLIARLIGAAAYKGDPPWTAEGLAGHLYMPASAIDQILEAMEREHLLSRTGDDPSAYLFTRPMDVTGVEDVLAAVRSDGERALLSYERLGADETVDALVERTEQAVGRSVKGYTLKDLAQSHVKGKKKPARQSGTKT